jgi:FkbH-like protein
LDTDFKQLIKQEKSWPSLKALLQNVRTKPFQACDVDLIYRALQKFRTEADIRVAYFGNYTLDPLLRYVAAVSALQGILVSDYVGPYNQYIQDVVNPDSEFAKFNPSLAFFSLSMRELSPKIFGKFVSLNLTQRKEELDRIVSHIGACIAIVKKKTDAALLISNFPTPPFPQAGIADTKLDFGEIEFYRQLNLNLTRTFRADPHVYIFDLDHILACRGKMRAFDSKMYYLAKIEWDEQSFSVMADEVVRYIWAIKGQTKKCLIVDLDNTLWGGVVGEDGVGGIRIGHGDPEGEAFFEFQQGIRSLKERGILLAICSKNNFTDAMEVFEARKDMPLSVEDFSAMRINWETKCQNIASIAADLNIGEDSLVFIDDNPAECELVRQMMPHVHTIHLPKDPSQYSQVLRQLFQFEKLSLTEEDRNKTLQYHQNTKRKEYQRDLGDVTKFLEGLGTTLTVRLATCEHLDRVHQLFSKTNQFNLTTKRYGPVEIEAFIEDDVWWLYVVEVTDNFGTLGIVGVFLLGADHETIVIDSFLLSCRAMGRGIETAMMNQIKNDFLLNRKYQEIRAAYRPTKKNIPVEKFYDQQGLSPVSNFDSGEKSYQLFRDKVVIIDCPGIQLLEAT